MRIEIRVGGIRKERLRAVCLLLGMGHTDHRLCAEREEVIGKTRRILLTFALVTAHSAGCRRWCVSPGGDAGRAIVKWL